MQQWDLAGGAFLPARATTTVALGGPSTINLGDLVLDTIPAGNLRIQAVKRGRGEGFRRASVSSLFGSVAQVGMCDAAGQAIFEDVPSRWFGFQDAHLLDNSTTTTHRVWVTSSRVSTRPMGSSSSTSALGPLARGGRAC